MEHDDTPILRSAEVEPGEGGGGSGDTPAEPVMATITIVYYNSESGTSTSSSVSYEVNTGFYDEAPSRQYFTVSPSSYYFTVTGDTTITYTYSRIQVYCTKYKYYDGVYVGYETEGPLSAGYTYTPDHPSHIPSADPRYDFSYSNPSGAITCPETNFTVDYYYIKVRVYGYIVPYYDQTSQGVSDTYLFTIGNDYNVAYYMPAYDSTQYKFDHAEINGVTLGSTFTAPNTDFWIDYFFVHKCQPYIYATKNDVTKWWPATVYIYKNSSEGWVQAQPYIYDNGEWN